MTAVQQSDPVAAQEALESGATVKTRRRLLTLSWMSIQSKVMVMLLLSSIVSVAVIGVIGFESGRGALRSAASQRLIELRESQKRAIDALFQDLTNSLVVYSRDASTIDAMRAFSSGFDQLASATIDPAQEQDIRNYYSRRVVQPTDRSTGNELNVNLLLPDSNAQKYLQAHYTAPFATTGDAINLNDAGDGSAWSAANARFNGYFREIVTRFQYRDALLLDTRGNVVYCANKDADLGTNVLTGPFRQSNLRDAYQKAMSANDIDFVWITDFQPYQAQLEMPTAWLVSPISTEHKVEGVMALPLPITKINAIMTANNNWKAAGMGSTTETYLAGPDTLMRSNSRLFVEDPKEYEREAVAAGTPIDVVREAIRFGGTTLLQPVNTAGWRAAERGQSGVVIATDYMGNEEMEAYSPLTVPNSDLHWSILATRDNSEALAPVASFTKTIVLADAGIILAICVASALLAQVFVRPLHRLETGTQRISAGDYNIAIPVTSRDEFGDLTAAFNEMSRNLGIKEEMLAEQRRENDRLLLSLMPEQVMRRYRDGERTIAQEHQDVTVIFADIIGFDEMSSDLSSDDLVRGIDALVRQFDSAAQAFGVERIRTLHTGYLASCGASVPRLDNVRRTVEFAIELHAIMDRFNSQTGYELGLRAGIDTGRVTSGLVGQSLVVYDMWGAAVSLAYQVHNGAPQAGIYVSSRVRDVVQDARQFAPAGTIVVGGSEQPIWRLTERQ